MRLELKFFLTWSFFSIIFFIFMSQLFPASEVLFFDREAELLAVSTSFEEQEGIFAGLLGSALSNSLFSGMLDFIFSMLGIDFISFIEGMPLWIYTFYAIWSTISIFMALFYLIDIIWIG